MAVSPVLQTYLQNCRSVWVQMRQEQGVELSRGTVSLEITEGGALADEIGSFLDCVHTRSAPLVGGGEALAALEIASVISRQL